jgi:twitching motility protein PilT
MNIEQRITTWLTASVSDLHLQSGQTVVVREQGTIRHLAESVSPEALAELELRYLDARQQARLATQGDADTAFNLGGIRLRANFYRSNTGSGCALRRLADQVPDPHSLQLPPAALGVSDETQGLILVTGPTGSGKTTTLAAVLGAINRQRACHILTLEDPIEYLHSSARSLVTQRQIGRDAATFAEGLRAALREDPDVILVGEMRDPETIQLALTAAETGHLVLTTLHTAGAANSVNRIIDGFPASQQNQVRAQLAQSLRIVLTQRLFARADGNGRIAAFEVMTCNNAIRNLIREGKTHQIESVLQTGREAGMQTLEAGITERVTAGLISRPA